MYYNTGRARWQPLKRIFFRKYLQTVENLVYCNQRMKKGEKIMGKFVIKKTPTGAFNFSLYAANSEKIAVASQVYSTKAACKKGMESVGKNAAKCIAEDRVEDQTLKKPESKTCPKFEIYFDKAGLYRYRLIAANGESIAMSEEGYKSKSGVMNGIKSVSVNAADAEIVDESLEK